MSSAKIPFVMKNYTLARCSLAPVEAIDINPISKALVAIDPWLTFGYSSVKLEEFFQRQDPTLFRYKVIVSEMVVGVACVRYPFLRGPYIELLALYENFQKKGIGKDVIRWIEITSREVSENLWLLVSSFNTGAIEFYKKMGFVEVGPIHDFVKPGYDEILLRKPK